MHPRLIATGIFLMISSGLAPVDAATLPLAERVAGRLAVEAVLETAREQPPQNPIDRPQPPRRRDVRMENALRGERAAIALERYWGRTIAPETLRREIERIRRDTKIPHLWQRIEAALGNDAVLLEEALARPLLAERLVREAYPFDSRFHGPTAAAARAAIASASDATSLAALAPESARMTFRRSTSGGGGEPARGTGDGWLIAAAQWDDFVARARAVPVTGAFDDATRARLRSILIEDEHAFRVDLELSRSADAMTLVRVSWPKGSVDAFLAGVEPGLGTGLLDAQRTSAPARDLARAAGDPAPAACSAAGWQPISSSSPPDPRKWHAMVWTGQEALVWGGATTSELGTNNGSRFDPSTDMWSPMSTANAPDGRFFPAACWSGSEMFVWGGQKGIPSEPIVVKGGLYDPVTDSWRHTSTFGAPPSGDGMTATWTGSHVVVAGASNATVGLYDPLADTWDIETAPMSLDHQSAVWTGTEIIYWGGLTDVSTQTNTGVRFDPTTRLFTAMTPAPIEPRTSHTAVWTGTEMIVWGGSSDTNPTLPGTGGVYDPLTDAWRLTSPIDAPVERTTHVAVWTGSDMVVWGGRTGDGIVMDYEFPEGGRYDPVTDTWQSLPTFVFSDHGGARESEAIWSGSEMMFFGGDRGQITQGVGGRFDPVSGTWLGMGMSSGPPARTTHRTVWTGAELIVWGGGTGWTQRDGRRYVPVLDVWQPMAVDGAPTARSVHESVWTGSEMLVWGGFDDDYSTEGGAALPSTGGRYDPSSDTWTAMSTSGAPVGRWWSASTWTGTEFFVWGGYNGVDLADGGLYDPTGDQWRSPTSTAAPPLRSEHEIVWVGSKAWVWGGYYARDTGALYDPVLDSWQATSMVDVPRGRHRYTASWTGGEVLVWSGFHSSGYVNDGASYDPATDQWVALPEAPVGPVYMSRSAWTGDRLFVWGGFGNSGSSDAGAYYDPVAMSWELAPTLNAPRPRYLHALAWIGTDVLVWGGNPGFSDGAILCADRPVGVEEAGAVPAAFAMSAPVPNPARGVTALRLVLARTTALRVDVIDVAGRVVATLARGRFPAGAHTIEWDGRDVASGVYFIRAHAEDGKTVRRVVRLER